MKCVEKILIFFMLLLLPALTAACKPPATKLADSDVSAVPACTVWPSHFMITKDNIPVFESTDALEENRDARYVGKNIPVIRELTILNEDKDAKLMRIIVRGGSLAGQQRWWTLAANLESRTKSKCPSNTPRKCDENSVHFCDENGCRCLDAGPAPDDPIGNAVIETTATMGLGSVKSLGFLLISHVGAVRVLPSAAASVATQFGDDSIDLVGHVASRPTLIEAEEFITNKITTFKAARKLFAEKEYYRKLDLNELGAIYYYTHYGYVKINRALRAGDTAVLKELRPMIEAASSGLTKIAEKAFAGNVYRGVSLSPQVSELYKPGAYVTEKAFTSASRNVAQTFSGNTLFQIVSKNGRMVDEISHIPKELEVLFSPGTVFKVLRRTAETINGRQVTKIVMEQVVQR